MPGPWYTKDEASVAWSNFRGSVMQRVLHQDLRFRVEQARTSLENAVGDDVLKLQAEIKAYRAFLSKVHSADLQEQVDLYARLERSDLGNDPR